MKTSTGMGESGATLLTCLDARGSRTRRLE